MRYLKGGMLLILLLFPILVLAERVFVTKTGHKYHMKQCKYLKLSSIPIEELEAKRMGYTSCAVCFNTSLSTSQETGENVILKTLSHQGVVVFAIGSIALLGLFFLIIKRKKRSIFRIKGNNLELSDQELSFLKTLIAKGGDFDTHTLNNFLELRGKSMDAQRKSRARFIKTLNDKLHQLHNIPEAILRIYLLDDKRIIHYSLSPEHTQLLRSKYDL